MAVIEQQSPTKRDSPVALGVFVAVTLLLSWTLSFVLITDTVPVYTALLNRF